MTQDPRQELDRLAFAVSHDLAAPVRHIAAFTQMALRTMDRDTDTAKAHLERVLAGAEQLHLMMDAMLFYSRVARIEQPLEDNDVGHLVDLAKDNHRDLIEAQRQSISYEGGPPIRAEPVQLARVVDEVVGNIASHAGRGAQARIWAGEDQHTAWIEAVDDGKGIHQERFGEAFHMFRRLDHTTAEHVGAGLSIAQRVCQRHGGRAELLPTPRGTHLRLTFQKTGDP